MTLLVNTHYKLPWIVWSRTYSITVPSGGYISDQTLAHGLPFTPLIFGQWSTNSNFNPSYDLGITIPGGSTGGQPETMCLVSADASAIHFDLINNALTTRTFYFKLMGFAPPNYTGQVNPVDYSSPFRFNSHYRYQQLYMHGQSSGTVNHNLGYLPQAKIWGISANRVIPSIGILTTTTLKSAASGSYYYHVYKDAF